MAQCARCKADTELHDTVVPVCQSCSVRARLIQEVLKKTANKAEAFRKFKAVMLQSGASGLPHPDGVQYIKNASDELSIARKRLTRAYGELSDYLDRGIVPEHLKP